MRVLILAGGHDQGDVLRVALRWLSFRCWRRTVFPALSRPVFWSFAVFRIRRPGDNPWQVQAEGFIRVCHALLVFSSILFGSGSNMGLPGALTE